MGRLLLGVLTAFSILGLAGPARAAEITNVASSGEPNDPFDIHISFRFDRLQERAQIGRERAVGGSVVDFEELRYTRKRGALVPRIAVGIFRDLEFHFEIPYVIYDDQTYRYGQKNGISIPHLPGGSTIADNDIDAQGQLCAVPCPLFAIQAPAGFDNKGTTVYHGGHAGDLVAGIDWGIFNDRKDDTKPFWLVGLDVTFPTAALYEPALNLVGPQPGIHTQSANPTRIGEKVWRWDLHTVLSRRMGPIEPYVKAHATATMKSNATYTNCTYADKLGALVPREFTSAGVTNCADPSWADDAGAKLPWIAGITFGTEVIPFQDEAQQQKVTLDLRLFADYTSSQRFYNELTDLSGKLHQTEGYLSMGGYIGLYLRASKYMSLHTVASLATQTSHFLSGESLGRNGSWPAVGSNGITVNPDGTPNPSLMNPNFDWRYDAPGRRFRLSEVSVFNLSVAGVLQF